MAKENCWEFNRCGREIGGVNAGKDGVCPAAGNFSADGFCGGKNGGRACIYVIGTLCGGDRQRTYESKEKQCCGCGFYLRLKREHAEGLTFFSYVDHVIKHDRDDPEAIGKNA